MKFTLYRDPRLFKDENASHICRQNNHGVDWKVWT